MTPTAKKRILKSGAEAHTFTREDASKGGKATAEKKRLEREEIKRLAAERLLEMVQPALARVEQIIDQGGDTDGLRASVEVLNRTLGKVKDEAEVNLTGSITLTSLAALTETDPEQHPE